jgi:gliding motility-associated-like protein
MKKVLFSIFLIVFCTKTSLFAQKQGNVWHFGQGAALDFNSGTAVVTTPSSMWTFEGSASICDENGNLLFYTNGGGRSPQLSGQPSGQIWNRNHELMYDMSFTEGGGFSSAQSSVIIPKPGAAGKYLLFTMDETEFNLGGSVPGQPLGRGLSYFEVDMALNGGLGGVSNYTESILVPSYEGLCAVRHSNGTDYWIVVHNGENGLAVFPVNSTGVGAPKFFPVSGGTSRQIKGSPDGKWLATVSYGSLTNVLIPFNTATGTLGTPLPLPTEYVSWEFAPNSQRLYTLDFDSDLLYFDLTSASTPFPATVMNNVSIVGGTNGQMQLAPDGKIYFLQLSLLADSVYLSTIVCPNSSPLLEFKKIAYELTDGSNFLGLPNFDNALFRRDNDLPVNLGADPTLCAGQTLVLNPGVANATYTWSNGAQTPTLNITTPGTYAVTVTSTGCGIGVDTVVVQPGIAPPNAGLNTNICTGAELPLIGSGAGTLSWSPANAVSDPTIANPIFTGNSTTTLVLTASENGCSASDTVMITVFPMPTVGVLPLGSTIIAGQSVGLSATSTATAFEWSPATGLSCTNCPNPVASPEATTTYFVTVTNNDGCTASASLTVEVISSDCTVTMPNAFTPNSDTNNDVFAPVGEAIEGYNLRIFNRWGQQVYNGAAGWNGTLDRQAAPMDVYVYKINVQVCGTQSEFLGEVTLIR